MLSAQTDYGFVSRRPCCACTDCEILTAFGECPRVLLWAVSFVDEAVARWIERALAEGVRVFFGGARCASTGSEPIVP